VLPSTALYAAASAAATVTVIYTLIAAIISTAGYYRGGE